jgi:glucose dehydrogenase
LWRKGEKTRMPHKVSKYVHKTWAYYVCGQHGRHYSSLEQVEIDHPEGYELIIKEDD